MSVSLSLVSLNIERSKHLDLVLAFLSSKRPDILCLQELAERDIPLFEKTLGTRCLFVPMTRFPEENARVVVGVGIFSNLPAAHSETLYYRGDPSHIPDFDLTSSETKAATENAPVVFVDVEKEGEIFRIATTHFTWTPDGQANDVQRRDLKNMLAILETVGECILCGDFNAPRGGEIFEKLKEVYTDNVPPHYTTSIDGSLHRSGPIPFMVDGMFSTSKYRVSGVQLIPGVSDHCALTATVKKSI